jgi:hypothetical protein
MGGSVEEAELNDDEAKKVAAALLVHLPRPFLQLRPNAVASPAPRNSPASMAMATEREMGREMMSGRLLGMV